MRPPNDPAARSGFTLVELMGVIVVLGLMVSVTTLNWQRMVPRAQLNSAVRVLSDTLHSTRTEAIARGLEYRVLYDLDEQRYWVETPFLKDGTGLALRRVEGEEDPDEERRAIVKESELEPGVLITGVVVDEELYTDGRVYVRFGALGESSQHTVTLYHEPTDRYYTIEVLALTGLIRFHEGEYRREELEEGDFD